MVTFAVMLRLNPHHEPASLRVMLKSNVPVFQYELFNGTFTVIAGAVVSTVTVRVAVEFTLAALSWTYALNGYEPSARLVKFLYELALLVEEGYVFGG